MMTRVLILLTLLIAAAMPTHAAPAQTSPVQLPATHAILNTLREGHPRVLATPEDFERLRGLMETDDQFRRLYKSLKVKGEGQLEEHVTKHHLRDGKRLLFESRETLDRALTLSMLYQLDGDRRWVDRVWKDMASASSFPDWNPNHFLDTAEMAAAFAIAYDWMYDAWTPEQRTTIREGVIRLGIKPAVAAYHNHTTYSRQIWWRDTDHNWNQVCNGGTTMAALAIANEDPELAAEAIHEAAGRLPNAMALYAPDGGYMEGPMYWGYGTTYSVLMLAALDSALGTDFGLSDTSAFDVTGGFPVHMTGPLDRTFNFADSRDRAVTDASLLWLADRFDQPAYRRYQTRLVDDGKQEGSRFSALNLLWYQPNAEDKALPRDAVYRRVGVATFRTAWDDRDAWFVGFKGGDNRFNHGNLDLGSFVLDAMGQRWAVDVGPDDYNMPGYFDRGVNGQRWTYYRMRAEGHNTLLINPGEDADQDPMAVAKIATYESEPSHASMTLDLTPGYAADAKAVQRTMTLHRGEGEPPRVTLEDRMELKQPGEVWWLMHTPAQITVADDGRSAMLTQSDAKLRVVLAESDGATDAKFEVIDAAPLPTSTNPAEQGKNPKVKRLAIHLKDVSTLTLRVEFRAP